MFDEFDAYLFDLDGVITPTVLLHRRAWQATFDEFFQSVGADPYRDSDYFESLDGKPRFEGVAALLAVRGIELSMGTPDDHGHDDPQTVMGLGNRKNEAFATMLERDGIDAYPGSVRLLERLAAANKPLAIVSSSRNAEAVLHATGLRDMFATVVDGLVAERERLPGKPAPDTFVRAAEILKTPPERCVVIEDAVSGVAAGRAGGFGLVVGVDRGTGRDALARAGAQVIVEDLQELV